VFEKALAGHVLSDQPSKGAAVVDTSPEFAPRATMVRLRRVTAD